MAALCTATLCLTAATPLADARPAAQLADGLRVHTGGLFGRNAYLYADDLAWNAVVVLSPGASIPPSAMADLARSMAARGALVLIVEYAQNIAVLPLPGNSRAAITIARAVHNRSLLGLPAQVAAALNTGLPVLGLGHSMGGAVLGSYGASPETPFDRLALYGTSQLVETPADVAVPVLILHGENDGLVTAERLETLARHFDTTPQPVPLVNHFCIVDDPEAGNPDYRARDRATPLNHDECVDAVVAGLDAAGFFPR
jgi:alpha-beta hydrolase superfamily lysophospholipase